MRPLVVFISIFMVAFFSLIYAFAQPSKSEFPPDMRRDIETSQTRPERKSTKDTNEPAPDVNSVVDSNDPNAVKAAYQMFAGLEEALERLNEVAEKEIREWQSKSESRTNLAKAVQEQIVRELTFIRKLAVEEKAAKTTAAIDGLLMMRKERFDETLERMEEIRKREERRERDRDRDDTERRRERQTRRRETPERRP